MVFHQLRPDLLGCPLRCLLAHGFFFCGMEFQIGHDAQHGFFPSFCFGVTLYQDTTLYTGAQSGTVWGNGDTSLTLGLECIDTKGFVTFQWVEKVIRPLEFSEERVRMNPSMVVDLGLLGMSIDGFLNVGGYFVKVDVQRPLRKDGVPFGV